MASPPTSLRNVAPYRPATRYAHEGLGLHRLKGWAYAGSDYRSLCAHMIAVRGDRFIIAERAKLEHARLGSLDALDRPAGRNPWPGWGCCGRAGPGGRCWRPAG